MKYEKQITKFYTEKYGILVNQKNIESPNSSFKKNSRYSNSTLTQSAKKKRLTINNSKIIKSSLNNHLDVGNYFNDNKANEDKEHCNVNKRTSDFNFIDSCIAYKDLVIKDIDATYNRHSINIPNLKLHNYTIDINKNKSNNSSKSLKYIKEKIRTNNEKSLDPYYKKKNNNNIISKNPNNSQIISNITSNINTPSFLKHFSISDYDINSNNKSQEALKIKALELLQKPFRNPYEIKIIVDFLSTLDNFMHLFLHENNPFEIIHETTSYLLSHYITKNSILYKYNEFSNAFYIIAQGESYLLDCKKNNYLLTETEYFDYLIKLFIWKEYELLSLTINENYKKFPVNYSYLYAVFINHLPSSNDLDIQRKYSSEIVLNKANREINSFIGKRTRTNLNLGERRKSFGLSDHKNDIDNEYVLYDSEMLIEVMKYYLEEYYLIMGNGEDGIKTIDKSELCDNNEKTCKKEVNNDNIGTANSVNNGGTVINTTKLNNTNKVSIAESREIRRKSFVKTSDNFKEGISERSHRSNKSFNRSNRSICSIPSLDYNINNNIINSNSIKKSNKAFNESISINGKLAKKNTIISNISKMSKKNITMKDKEIDKEKKQSIMRKETCNSELSNYNNTNTNTNTCNKKLKFIYNNNDGVSKEEEINIINNIYNKSKDRLNKYLSNTTNSNLFNSSLYHKNTNNDNYRNSSINISNSVIKVNNVYSISNYDDLRKILNTDNNMLNRNHSVKFNKQLISNFNNSINNSNIINTIRNDIMTYNKANDTNRSVASGSNSNNNSSKRRIKNSIFVSPEINKDKSYASFNVFSYLDILKPYIINSNNSNNISSIDNHSSSDSQMHYNPFNDITYVKYRKTITSNTSNFSYTNTNNTEKIDNLQFKNHSKLFILNNNTNQNHDLITRNINQSKSSTNITNNAISSQALTNPYYFNKYKTEQRHNIIIYEYYITKKYRTGDYFGNQELFLKQNRQHTVFTTNNTILLSLTKKNFIKLIHPIFEKQQKYTLQKLSHLSLFKNLSLSYINEIILKSAFVEIFNKGEKIVSQNSVIKNISVLVNGEIEMIFKGSLLSLIYYTRDYCGNKELFDEEIRMIELNDNFYKFMNDIMSLKLMIISEKSILGLEEVMFIIDRSNKKSNSNTNTITNNRANANGNRSNSPNRNISINNDNELTNKLLVRKKTNNKSSSNITSLLHINNNSNSINNIDSSTKSLCHINFNNSNNICNNSNRNNNSGNISNTTASNITKHLNNNNYLSVFDFQVVSPSVEILKVDNNNLDKNIVKNYLVKNNLKQFIKQRKSHLTTTITEVIKNRIEYYNKFTNCFGNKEKISEEWMSKGKFDPSIISLVNIGKFPKQKNNEKRSKTKANSNANTTSNANGNVNSSGICKNIYNDKDSLMNSSINANSSVIKKKKLNKHVGFSNNSNNNIVSTHVESIKDVKNIKSINEIPKSNNTNTNSDSNNKTLMKGKTITADNRLIINKDKNTTILSITREILKGDVEDEGSSNWLKIFVNKKENRISNSSRKINPSNKAIIEEELIPIQEHTEANNKNNINNSKKESDKESKATLLSNTTNNTNNIINDNATTSAEAAPNSNLKFSLKKIFQNKLKSKLKEAEDNQFKKRLFFGGSSYMFADMKDFQDTVKEKKQEDITKKFGNFLNNHLFAGEQKDKLLEILKQSNDNENKNNNVNKTKKKFTFLEYLKNKKFSCRKSFTNKKVVVSEDKKNEESIKKLRNKNNVKLFSSLIGCDLLDNIKKENNEDRIINAEEDGVVGNKKLSGFNFFNAINAISSGDNGNEDTNNYEVNSYNTNGKNDSNYRNSNSISKTGFKFKYNGNGKGKYKYKGKSKSKFCLNNSNSVGKTRINLANSITMKEIFKQSNRFNTIVNDNFSSSNLQHHISSIPLLSKTSSILEQNKNTIITEFNEMLDDKAKDKDQKSKSNTSNNNSNDTSMLIQQADDHVKNNNNNSNSNSIICNTLFSNSSGMNKKLIAFNHSRSNFGNKRACNYSNSNSNSKLHSYNFNSIANNNTNNTINTINAQSNNHYKSNSEFSLLELLNNRNCVKYNGINNIINTNSKHNEYSSNNKKINCISSNYDTRKADNYVYSSNKKSIFKLKNKLNQKFNEIRNKSNNTNANTITNTVNCTNTITNNNTINTDFNNEKHNDNTNKSFNIIKNKVLISKSNNYNIFNNNNNISNNSNNNNTSLLYSSILSSDTTYRSNNTNIALAKSHIMNIKNNNMFKIKSLPKLETTNNANTNNVNTNAITNKATDNESIDSLKEIKSTNCYYNNNNRKRNTSISVSTDIRNSIKKPRKKNISINYNSIYTINDNNNNNNKGNINSNKQVKSEYTIDLLAMDTFKRDFDTIYYYNLVKTNKKLIKK